MTTIPYSELFQGNPSNVVILVDKAGVGLHTEMWEKLRRTHHDLVSESEIQGILGRFEKGVGLYLERSSYSHAFCKVFCVEPTEDGIHWLKEVLQLKKLSEVALPNCDAYDKIALADMLDEIGTMTVYYDL